MAKRSRLSIAQAVHRLSREQLLPLCELKDLAQVSELTLRRWAVQGRSGRYLDALHRPGKGWLSSKEAVLRFIAEVRLTELMTPTSRAETGPPHPLLT